jgi:hypothetical protein
MIESRGQDVQSEPKDPWGHPLSIVCRRARVQGGRGNVQEIKRVLRRRSPLRLQQPLLGVQRLSNRRPAVLPAHGLLLGRVHAQPYRRAGVPRFLRANRGSMHGRRGLLLGKLRWLPHALFAGPIGLVALRR